MFDWANQPYFTVVITFIYGPYFVTYLVGDPVQGQSLWGYTQSAAGLLIALTAPFLGAIADAGGPRKPWILAFTALCIVGAGALWFGLPGADWTMLAFIMAMVVVGTVGVEFAVVFNNAMLPNLVPDDRMGRLSGFGWGLGYVGGLVALVIVLAVTLPEPPLFGLDRASQAHNRFVGPLTAVWFALFVIPMFVFTPDQPRTGLGRAAAVRAGITNLLTTLGKLRQYRNIALYLVARMIYYDGQTAIFAFGGIYAAGLFGWGTTELGLFGIIILVFGAVGCFVGGAMDDRLGSRFTVTLALIGLLIATLGVLSIGDGKVLFVVPAALPVADDGLFATPAEWLFIALAVLLGISGGPAQAASRTMLARLAPRDMVAEFYGLYALSGKATAFMAPFAVGVLTQATDSQRGGLSIVVVFLVVGLVLLRFVHEQRTEPLTRR